MRPGRILTLAVLALAAGAVALPATAGAAATFPKGTLTLTFDPAFRKLADLRLTGGMDGKFSNRAGTGTMQTDNTGTGSLKTLTATAESRTLWRFAAGSRVIRFRATRLNVRRGKVSVEPGVLEQGGRRVKLFETTGKGTAKAGRGFATLEAKGLPLALTTAGAAAFNAALKTKAFKKGAKVGTLSFTLERQLWAQGGGQITVLFDAGIADAVEACEGLLPRLQPNTTEIPASESAPKGGFSTQILRQNVFTPRDGVLGIQASGGFALNKGRSDNTLGTVSFASFTVTRTSIDRVTLQGTTKLADLSGGTFSSRLTATGGSVSVTGATATVASAFSKEFLDEAECVLPVGTRIGTVSATAAGE